MYRILIDTQNLILNEPAGELGKIILMHTVKLVVKAWDDTSVNVNQVTEEVLECLCVGETRIMYTGSSPPN